MTTQQGFRFALDPTQAQRRALASHCGAARFAYNWGLREIKSDLNLRTWEKQLLGGAMHQGVGWNTYALRKQWNQEKEKVAPWWRVNSKEAYAFGLACLATALQNWSQSKKGARQGPTMGFPKKKKKWSAMTCKFSTGSIRVDDERHITLPRIGRLRTSEPTNKLLSLVQNSKAKIQSATVSCEAGRWFVSFGCLVERNLVADNGHQDVIGVDLGVTTWVALSNGEKIAGPRALRSNLKRLKRMGRAVSRKKKDSHRRVKMQARLARQHARVAHLRKDAIHKLTTQLAQNHGTIVVEDLAVKNMTLKPRRKEDPENQGNFLSNGAKAKAGLNRGILDGGFYEIRRQLDYKQHWYGCRLLVAPRFFPSSKRCSDCGEIKEKLARSARIFHCDACGMSLDRDVNAARNLEWWASHQETEILVAGSAPETENAHGGAVNPEVTLVGTATRKKEVGTRIALEPASKTGSQFLAEVGLLSVREI